MIIMFSNDEKRNCFNFEDQIYNNLSDYSYLHLRPLDSNDIRFQGYKPHPKMTQFKELLYGFNFPGAKICLKEHFPKVNRTFKASLY